MSAGGKAVLGLHHQSGNLTRLLLVPHIHALSLLFPNSTTEGARGDLATWKIIFAGKDKNCHGQIIGKHSWP